MNSLAAPWPFARGIAIGLAVAAPVGPMCVLCVRRTLVAGRGAGIATGLGIATADAIYAAVATLALGGAARLLAAFGTSLHLATAAVLVVLAVRTLSTSHAAGPRATSHRGAFTSALLLTMANPTTIVSFAALVAASAGASPSLTGAVQTIAGVFAGSSAWWLVATSFVAGLRIAPGARTMRTIDALVAFVFLAFAALETRRAFF